MTLKWSAADDLYTATTDDGTEYVIDKFVEFGTLRYFVTERVRGAPGRTAFRWELERAKKLAQEWADERQGAP